MSGVLVWYILGVTIVLEGNEIFMTVIKPIIYSLLLIFETVKNFYRDKNKKEIEEINKNSTF